MQLGQTSTATTGRTRPPSSVRRPLRCPSCVLISSNLIILGWASIGPRARIVPGFGSIWGTSLKFDFPLTLQFDGNTASGV